MEKEIGIHVAIPTFTDLRGNLSVAELQKTVPFRVQRVFYLYGVPQGAVRGDHATFSPEFVICAAGSCKIRLNDGETETEELLSSPASGILIPPLTWRTFSCFSEDCLLICFSDRPYREDDIIRDFDRFRKLRESAAKTLPATDV